MTEESPRYKQLFAYLTQSSSEEELDKVVGDMTMEGLMDKITCPTLIVTGEYDPRAPIEEVYRLFDQMKAPAELWVLPDQHHNGSITQKARSSVWEADIHAFRVRLAARALQRRAGEASRVRRCGSSRRARVRMRRR